MDVDPGEVVWVDEDGCHKSQAAPRGRKASCIFEHVYFARTDSLLDGTGVHAARVRMGERLAEEAPVDADLVMPIPDSGTPAAIGFAKRSGLPYEEGLIKNRYVGRTFIEPDQALRRQGIKLKFNPLANWTREQLDAYFEEHDLPRHPLEAQGYPSIGCSPCTSKVQPGEDPRSGRWRGWDKTECGIHEAVTLLDDDPANDPAF